MTHRQWIESMGTMRPELIAWLEWLFPGMDLATVRIKIAPVRAYGKDWAAVSDCSGVTINTADWQRPMNTNAFMQTMAHELTHVWYCRHRGWLRWTLGVFVTIARSIRTGSLYNHDLCSEERQAETNRARWVDRCWDARNDWENLLDSRV